MSKALYKVADGFGMGENPNRKSQKRASLGLKSTIEKLDGITNSLDAFCLLIGDLEVKLALKLHDELNEVYRIGTEIFLEVGLLGYFTFFNGQFIGNDFDYAFAGS